MKNVILNLRKGILMVAMSTTMLSFANDFSIIKVKNGANKTSVTLTDVKEGNLLSIKDENGIVLYKEFIQKSGSYSKGFDLTELPDGSYLFEIDKDVEIDTIPFTVEAEVVTFAKEEEKVIYKPVTRVVGDLLYVTKLSLDESPLEIDIFYETSAVNGALESVHSETIQDSKVIERVYKLEDFNQGTFEIVYHTDGRIFTEVIK
jgi:alpha-D-ribose 1-methylphosphonate 5-phosphate C-P lyase